MRRVRLRLIGIGILVFVATAGISPSITHVPPTFFVGSPAFTDRQRMEAMLSVHAHARFFNDPRVSSPFMSLFDAVNILDHDTGSAARSRERRALAKLSAYNYAAYEPLIENLADNPPLILEIEQYLATPIAAAATAMQRELKIFNMAEALSAEDCRILAVKIEGQPHDPPPVRWKYSYLVQRSMAEVARAVDPQSWSQCRTMFQDTHLVDEPACCPNDDSDKMCSTGPPVAGPSYARGRPYGRVALFESFCASDNNTDCPSDCTNAPCDVAFQNVLCVQTDYDVPVWGSSDVLNASTYDVDYDFGRFLFGEFLGQDGLNQIDQPPPYEIDRDKGKLHVGPPSPENLIAFPVAATGTWSVADVSKELSFKDPALDEIVGDTLVAMTAVEDELGGQIVELVCCDIMAEEWGTGILAWLERLFRQILTVRWPIPWRIVEPQ